MNYIFSTSDLGGFRISDALLQSENWERFVEIFSHSAFHLAIEELVDDKTDIDLADYFESIAAIKRRVSRLNSLNIAFMAKAYRAAIVNHCNVFERDRLLLAAHYYIYINSDKEDHQSDSVCKSGQLTKLQTVSGRWFII